MVWHICNKKSMSTKSWVMRCIGAKKLMCVEQILDARHGCSIEGQWPESVRVMRERIRDRRSENMREFERNSEGGG